MSVFCVRKFGAVGDGQTNDTAAIRSALVACAEAGGGRVTFPAGDYLCGTLRLTDHLTLHLDAGAVLRESYQDDIEVTAVGVGIERPHLIVGEGVEHVGITGPGIILGRGESDSPGLDNEARGFRSGILFLRNCRHVRLNDFTIRYGDGWTVHLAGCEHVTVRGVSIFNNLHRIGGNDGLDLNGCREVRVSDCHIEAWDDCIVLKAKDMDTPGDATDCEQIVVTNCTFQSGCTALKLGSESVGNFRDIRFSHCTIYDSSVGFGIYLLDGGTVERISFTDISMRIVADQRYRPHMEAFNCHLFPICFFVGQREDASPVGTLRDITVRDVHAVCSHGVVILGHAERSIENLTLENVTLRVERQTDYVPRNLPCSRGFLENQQRRVTRTGDNGADPIVTILPADEPIAHHPAYLNVSRVSDLRLENIRVYLPATINNEDPPRVGIALDALTDAAVGDCMIRRADGTLEKDVRFSPTCRGVSLSGSNSADASLGVLDQS